MGNVTTAGSDAICPYVLSEISGVATLIVEATPAGKEM